MDIVSHQTPEEEAKQWAYKALGFYAIFHNAKEDKEHSVDEIQDKWKAEDEATQKAWIHVARMVELTLVNTIRDIEMQKNAMNKNLRIIK
jgi:hypothetical protein